MAKSGSNKQKPDFINNLQKVLEDEGIKQSELASDTKVSGSTINKVARQKLAITITTQSKLLKGINKRSAKPYERNDIFPNGGRG